MYLTLQVKYTETRKFPFHKIYVCTESSIEHLMKGLPCCIVIPPEYNGELLSLLKSVTLQSIAKRAFDTNDSFKIRKTEYDEKDFSRVVDKYLKCSLSDIHIIVPVLQKYTNWRNLDGELIEAVNVGYLQSELAGKPDRRTYVGSRQAAKQEKEGVHPEFIPAGAYLKLPTGQQISPVCASCPNNLMHILGKCSLGTKICLEKINIGGKSSIINNLQTFREKVESM